jgi:hypothetical protein
MLKEVMGNELEKPAAPKLHPTVVQQRDALLHTYLKAAREKVKQARAREGHRVMPDPA